MRTVFLLLASLSLLAVSGCANYYVAPVMPPGGWIYSDIKAPMDTDVQKTPVSPKSGEASSMSILGAVATGDASVRTAAANGDIKTIDHVDYTFFNVLGVYSKFTTKVYGE